MKRIILIFVLSIFITAVYAQRVGIKAGLNLGNAQYEYTKTSIGTSNLAGFQIGIITETPLSNELFLNSGILYSQKGTKLSVMGIEAEFPIQYLEIPFGLTYKYDLVNSKIYAQAGPYLGAGLSAKMKAGGDEQSLEFGSDTDQMKRFDIGFNFGAGLEIKKVQLGINYGLGLVNLSNDPDEMIKNGVLSFSLALFFRN